MHFARVLGPGSRLIVGVDLDKDPRRLDAAYDDAKGVTARFNLNLLARINRELGGDFDLARFRHRAIYDQELKRIEMHLVSRVRTDGAGARPAIPLRGRRDHPHGELLQVFDRAVPRARPGRRLAAGTGVDRPRPRLQRARAAAAGIVS